MIAIMPGAAPALEQARLALLETTNWRRRGRFTGIYDRHPKLKIITHHMGGGMIPFFDGRINARGGCVKIISGTPIDDPSGVLAAAGRNVP